MVDAPEPDKNLSSDELHDLFMGKIESISQAEEPCCTSGVHDPKVEQAKHAQSTSNARGDAAEVGMLTR